MSTLAINGVTAFVSGANRGIGRALVEALLDRGAKRVYAAARKPETMADLIADSGDRVVAIELDVTKAGQLERAAAAAGDVNLLINNAGIATGFGKSIIDRDYLEHARAEMEVNYFGLVALTQALAPALVANSPGAIVNLSSIAGLTNFPPAPTYSAAKAAVRSIGQSLRVQLGPSGISTHTVYPGPVDTDMAKDLEMDKASPAHVAGIILDGVEAGTEEIYPDPMAEEFGRQFEASPSEHEKQVALMAAG